MVLDIHYTKRYPIQTIFKISLPELGSGKPTRRPNPQWARRVVPRFSKALMILLILSAKDPLQLISVQDRGHGPSVGAGLWALAGI